MNRARLLDGPILPTLLRLALPNVLAMVAAAAVGVAETRYVGMLGMEALAAMALVFPFTMLMQMFSSGAMGGGISSAVSRALGAGDRARAESLALHAALIGLGAGLAFTALFTLGGHALYALLGGRGGVLAQALRYSDTLFAGVSAIWLANSLISVLRGTGDMRTPSVTVLATSALQVTLGATLGLGLGPVPRLGMRGVALGQVLAYAAATAFLLWWLTSGRARLRLRLRRRSPGADAFADILRVGAVACLSPLQSVATVLVLTALVARVGTEALAGYGIGARLEFLLIPIAFGVGVAAVPMVGMAIGAGDVARARRVAWTSAAVSAAVLGAIGAVVATLPDLWAALFTERIEVLEAARQYLRWAGPAFAFFGVGLTLYFAAQGSGKVLGPVLAATLRLAIVAGVGAVLAASAAPAWAMFALVGAAMIAYGAAAALSVWITPWGRAVPRAAVQPV